MRLARLLFLCALLSGCALPVAETDRQDYVPKRDLTVVSMVREGLAYYQKSRFVDAEFSFRQALYLYPTAPNIKANLAAALRANGQFDEAEDILIALNAGAPKSLDFISSLARLYVEKGDYVSARKYFTQAYDIALDKQDFVSASRYARSLSAIAFRIGDESTALCQSMIANSLSGNADNMARHARLLLATHQTEKAEQQLKGYLNQPGIVRDPTVMHELAMAHFASREYREVIDLERTALESPSLDRTAQAEARLILALARRHLKEAEDTEAIDTSIEEESAEDALTTELTTAVSSTPEKSSLYWPIPLVDEVAAFNEQSEKSKE